MSGKGGGILGGFGCLLLFLIFGVPLIGSAFGKVGEFLGLLGPITAAFLAAGAVAVVLAAVLKILGK